MSVTAIVTAVAVCGILALIIGIVLGLVSNKFEVEVDERVTKVREHLAGSNCGGCGFAGCDACAEAIVNGSAAPNACAPAGAENAKAIGAIMGVSVGDTNPKRAFVKCNGTCDKAVRQSNYYGIMDCVKASTMPGGSNKACTFGCMGMGSCVAACKYDAIHIVNGIALVDQPEKCVACGACVRTCPKHLIELIPVNQTHMVRCSSPLPMKQVKEVCSAGCIGCGACVKQCEHDAVHVENHLAYIDPAKCTNCGKCAAKCPVKVITTGEAPAVSAAEAS